MTKQAKILNEKQIKAVLGSIDKHGRNGMRNRVMFLLSVHAGLRAKEIADLKVSMVTDAEGQVGEAINLTDEASKGRSGRVIPMSNELRRALLEYLEQRSRKSSYVVCTERSDKFSANAVAVFFHRLYTSLGFTGASSHSGRRGFITHCARKVPHVGGSLRDVMALAGHKNLSTTQRYIDQDPEAQRKLIDVLF